LNLTEANHYFMEPQLNPPAKGSGCRSRARLRAKEAGNVRMTRPTGRGCFGGGGAYS
jgi:hypothetical protein